MTEGAKAKLQHLIIEGFSETGNYSRPKEKIDSPEIANQDRNSHGSYLLGQIETLNNDMLSALQIQEKAGIEADRGLRIEFESFPEIKTAFESLSFGSTGIELLNIRRDGSSTFATIFVPDGQLQYFVKKIEEYLQFKKDKNGKPDDNRKFVDTIKEIRVASLRALWTDAEGAFPKEQEKPFWWEAWLPIRENREKTIRAFRDMATKARLQTSNSEMRFPERSVLLIFADLEKIQNSLMILNTVAELRRAKETADFFVELHPHEEKVWVDDLVDRTEYADDTDAVPRICLLDTGVNRIHPLLEKAIDPTDLYSVNLAWETVDREGHGTSLAGLALYGDLSGPLSSKERISLSHRLESSKLLPKDGSNVGDDHLHANLTSQAVYLPEIAFPKRRRVFELAISADDYRDKGRPSAWSSAIDQLAADSDNSGDAKGQRLFVVSAGNIRDNHKWERYPSSNDEEGIHDPGQAWNALTVGACTNKVDIQDEGAQSYIPIAPAGDISPFSTTSYIWEPQWPLKPDVVIEGGNVARDSLSAAWLSSLSLLTTNHTPSERLLRTANATSAASALVARIAAQIMAQYPTLRPETIRGLIVHSAQWTDAMKTRYRVNDRSQKGDYANLVRHCGFGVPDLDQALWSLTNSVTMVIEESFKPFTKRPKGTIRMNEMHYHKLPWPRDVLSDMGETEVEMRVTLSYFIEPNPSSRGRSKYCYESHGLRFDVQQPTETFEHFKGRKNSDFRQEGTEYKSANDSTYSWDLGEKNRHRGSIHSDTWKGTAVGLANCGAIAVFPTGGWWQKRTALEKYDSEARYSLIVSIRSPKIDVDLYTPIETMVKTKIEIS